MLVSLFDLVRDLVVMAAAAGIAKWTWDQHRIGPQRRDEEASAAMTAERLQAETRQWSARMEAIAIDVSTRLDELIERQRDAEVRVAAKLAVHRLLQTTQDPFLTFREIETALAEKRPEPEAATPLSPSEVASPAAPPADFERLAGDALRRVLMELVADGVIAQLDADRYFIASDFETGAHDGAADSDEG